MRHSARAVYQVEGFVSSTDIVIAIINTDTDAQDAFDNAALALYSRLLDAHQYARPSMRFTIRILEYRHE